MFKFVGYFVAFSIVGGGAALAADAKPSFDCGSAKKSSERAICDYAKLAKLDKHVMTTYLKAVKIVAPGDRGKIRWEHKAFMVTRDKCGYSSGCIEMRYNERLARLGYWQKKSSHK